MPTDTDIFTQDSSGFSRVDRSADLHHALGMKISSAEPMGLHGLQGCLVSVCVYIDR